jgi:glutamine---fructose-6-phosphate transaminase (isomerizing)
LAALAHLTAAWSGDGALDDALTGLPDVLTRAWSEDWSAAVRLFADARSLFVLGRGPTLGVAQEAALKFKETSGIHAEAFSVAEVAHGPMALVGAGFPVLAFPPLDQAAIGLGKIVAQFRARGAQVAVAGLDLEGAITLPVAAGLDPAIAPIALIQSFYAMVCALSVQRGFDPDHPPMLNKVTETR